MTTATTTALSTSHGRVPAPVSTRIASLDIIRGAVMVLMALDHVRVYSGIPAGGPTLGVFFTRWVTHFCAPAFVFLAGTGAFLHGERLRDRGALTRYLVTRGAILVLLDITVNRVAWTFNLDFARYAPTNVIWAIGWCMILLAVLVRLPATVVGLAGTAIVAAHNLVGPALGPAARESAVPWLWQILYYGGPFRLGESGPMVLVLYSIVPWIGVMMAGYGFGRIMQLEEAPRRRACLAIGLGAIALFLLLRGFNLYGDPRAWGGPDSRMPALLGFLNTSKYPASLLFLLMTLGPTIALIPLLERARSRAAGWLTVIGRVPLFFYVLHIPFIHLVAIAISAVRTPEHTGWLFTNHPMAPPEVPDGYQYSLPLLYAVTLAVSVALYFPCRWYARAKAEKRRAWMAYL